MLDVDGGRRVEATWRALNEVVVEKHESGHTVRLLAGIAGEPFTSYAADGLIVATPTGSTAYSLSARGPVVSPRHRALLLTPVSPHMLFDRTLVLDPTETVEIEVAGYRRAGLAVDGQLVATLDDGDVVTCRAGRRDGPLRAPRARTTSTRSSRPSSGLGRSARSMCAGTTCDRSQRAADSGRAPSARTCPRASGPRDDVAAPAGRDAAERTVCTSPRVDGDLRDPVRNATRWRTLDAGRSPLDET